MNRNWMNDDSKNIVAGNKIICKRLAAILLLALALVVLAGCGQKKAAIPFTEIDFTSTIDDVFELEGTTDDTYESVYYGTTYSYPKEYMGKMGKIKYMTDENNVIQRIAWAYETDNEEDLVETGDAIYNDFVKTYGQPAVQEGVNNASQIWRRPNEGNIIISAVLTTDSKLVQVAFFSPESSTNE